MHNIKAPLLTGLIRDRSYQIRGIGVIRVKKNHVIRICEYNVNNPMGYFFTFVVLTADNIL
jgi:hypothetical protein